MMGDYQVKCATKNCDKTKYLKIVTFDLTSEKFTYSCVIDNKRVCSSKNNVNKFFKFYGFSCLIKYIRSAKAKYILSSLVMIIFKSL